MNADETPPISDEAPPTRDGPVSIAFCSVQVRSTSTSSEVRVLAAVCSVGGNGWEGSEVSVAALWEKRGGGAVVKGAELKQLDGCRKEG